MSVPERQGEGIMMRECCKRIRVILYAWAITGAATQGLAMEKLEPGGFSKSLDAGHEEQLWALDGLAAMGPAAKEAVPAIIRCLEENPDLTVRLRAVSTLGRIGEPVEQVTRALLEAGASPLPEIRYNACLALERLPDPSVSMLFRAALRDERPWIRLQAAKALAARGGQDSATTGTLTELLREDDIELQCDAALTLGKLGAGSTGAVTLMRGMLHHESPKARRIAAHSLGLIGPNAVAASPDLRACLGHKDRDVRRDAISALAGIKDTSPETIKALAAALEDSQERVRNQAISALAGIGEKALPSIVEQLQSAHDHARAAACAALGLMGNAASPAADVLLQCLLNDSADNPKINAACALGEIGVDSKKVLTGLRTARDEAGNHPMIRFHAGESLIRLTGDPTEAAPESLFRNEPLVGMPEGLDKAS